MLTVSSTQKEVQKKNKRLVSTPSRRGKQSDIFYIDWNDRQVRAGSRIFALTTRFFDLCCFLAIMRIEDPKRNGGYVEAEEIQQIKSWGKNSGLSIGKQISRHRHLSQSNSPLVQAVRKVGGPFRLAFPKANIRSDVTLDTLKVYLGISSSTYPLRGGEESQFYRYVDHVCKGSLKLEDGSLEESLGHYQEAARLAIHPYDKAAALHNVSRIQERLGHYDESLKVCDKSLEVLRQARQYRDWGEARSYSIQALTRYRLRELDQAQRLFEKALTLVRGTGQLRVLGEIYNGMGVVAAARQQYSEALAFYQQALEQWVLVEYLYGIQSLYFGIGRLHMLWAKHLSGVDQQRSLQEFAIAKVWFEECIALCAAAGTGYDLNDAEVALASVYRHLGDLQKALKQAENARSMAEQSGNSRGLRNAYRSLLKVYIAVGDGKKVQQILHDARTRFDAQYVKELEAIAGK